MRIKQCSFALVLAIFPAIRSFSLDSGLQPMSVGSEAINHGVALKLSRLHGKEHSLSPLRYNPDIESLFGSLVVDSDAVWDVTSQEVTYGELLAHSANRAEMLSKIGSAIKPVCVFDGEVIGFYTSWEDVSALPGSTEPSFMDKSYLDLRSVCSFPIRKHGSYEEESDNNFLFPADSDKKGNVYVLVVVVDLKGNSKVVKILVGNEYDEAFSKLLDTFIFNDQQDQDPAEGEQRPNFFAGIQNQLSAAGRVRVIWLDRSIKLVRVSDNAIIHEAPLIRVYPGQRIPNLISSGTPVDRISRKGDTKGFVFEHWAGDPDREDFFIFAQKCHGLLERAFGDQDPFQLNQVFCGLGVGLVNALENDQQHLDALTSRLGSKIKNRTMQAVGGKKPIEAAQYAEIIVRDLIAIVRVNADRKNYTYALMELLFAVRNVLRSAHGVCAASTVVNYFETSLLKHQLWRVANPPVTTPSPAENTYTEEEANLVDLSDGSGTEKAQQDDDEPFLP